MVGTKHVLFVYVAGRLMQSSLSGLKIQIGLNHEQDSGCWLHQDQLMIFRTGGGLFPTNVLCLIIHEHRISSLLFIYARREFTKTHLSTAHGTLEFSLSK
jgi:hypothetical protein